MAKLVLQYSNAQQESIDLKYIHKSDFDTNSKGNILTAVYVEDLIAADGSELKLSFGKDQIISVTSRLNEPFAEVAIRLPALFDASVEHWGDSNNYLLRLKFDEQGVVGFRMTAKENTWLIFLPKDCEIAAKKNDFGKLNRSIRYKPPGSIQDQFLNKKNDRMVCSKEFPFDDLYFIHKVNCISNEISDRVAVGIHETSDGSLFLVLVHSRDAVSRQYTLKTNIFGKRLTNKYKASNYHPTRLTYLINIIPLGLGSRSWIHVWNGYSKTGIQDFLQTYNHSVDVARKGLWQARNDIPWVVNPSLNIDDCSALYLYKQDAQQTHQNWIDVIATDDNASKKSASLRYEWKFAPPERDDIAVEVDAFIQSSQLQKPSEDNAQSPLPQRRINDINKQDNQVNRDILSRLLEKAARLSRLDSDHAIDAEIRLSTCQRTFNATDSYLPFGSIAINFGRSLAADDSHTEGDCTLRLRSDNNPKRSGAFASSTSKDMQVKVRFAGGGDVGERYTSFNLSEELEDQLHRPTETMVHFRDLHSQTGIEATLKILTENRYGSQETAELTLSYGESKFNTNNFSIFQARPFIYAAISGVDLDPEGGSILARWRSDDAREWRMPYRSTTLELPAQSIGEEMERGSRFWPVINDDGNHVIQPYIDPNKPVRFRFSPNTRLSIEPDGGRRRYNSVPSNISRIARAASVKSFQTEMVYPVAIGYKRGNRPSVQVMLSETAVFLGDTGPNLPFLGSNETDNVDIAKQIFDGSLGNWADTYWYKPEWQGIRNAYSDLRVNNSAAKANYASRIAQLVLWDGNRPQDSFLLDEDLSFEIRSNQHKSAEKRQFDLVDMGIDQGGFPTPPLLSPLPTNPKGVDLSASEKNRIAAFLSGSDWDELGSKGGIRGGVLHTIEFPSELFAILRNPKSKVGWIGNVSFSNMGVSGQMEVAFDEGRTTFTAEVENGQLSRLIRRRIGKIACVWARCRHVIVYSRVTLPSPQFANEQEGAEFPGWPLLRKIEEYIEPIDEIRVWNNEADADRSSTACFREFEWITKRIYVNSSWGEELTGPISGYKIPLWDGGVSEQDQSFERGGYTPGNAPDKDNAAGWYYPKPKLSLNAREEGGNAIRHWCCDPEELYFYTNTQEGAGPDPDTWPPVPGVDSVEGIMRVGVLTQKPNDWANFIGKRAKASPRRDSMRRKGFDLRVNPDAAVNLQEGRSDKALFTKVHLVSLARSAEQSVPHEALSSEILTAKFKALQDSAELSGAIADVTAPITRWVKELDKRLEQFSCDASAQTAIDRELEELRVEAKAHVRMVFNSIPPTSPALPAFEVVRKELEQEIAGLTLTSPSTIEEFAMAVREYIQRDVRLPDSGEPLKETQRDIQRRGRIICDRIRNAAMSIKREISDKAGAASGEIAELIRTIGWAKDELKALRTAVNSGADLTQPLKKAREALDKAEKATRKIQKPPYVKVAKQVLTLLKGTRRLLRTSEELYKTLKDQTREGLKKADSQLQLLESALSKMSEQVELLSQFLVEDVDKQFKRLVNDNPAPDKKGAVNKLESLLDSIVDKTHEETEKVIQELALHLTATVDRSEKSALGMLQSVNNEIRKALSLKLDNLALQLSESYTKFIGAYTKAVSEFVQATGPAESWFDKQIDDAVRESKRIIKEIFDQGTDICREIRERANEIKSELDKAKTQLEEKLRSDVQDVFDEQTRRDFEDLELEARKNIEDIRKYGQLIGEVDRGLKVVKAIGDMPSLPDLTFNADSAEYIFDDVRSQITTSPFGARVKEIESGLRELGVNIPVDGILDQLLPTSDNVNAKFNQIMKGIGGMDFEGLLQKLRLPQIKRDQYRITHGIDEKSRTAWLKSRVNVNIQGRNALFEAGAFGVYMSKMSLRGSSDIMVRLDGHRESVTDGKLSADWGLRLGGTEVATFKEVTIRYDGSSLDFDIDPTKIEYHPTLRFVSDVAKLLEESIPPGVKLLKDERGRPYGAEARLETVIDNPPPLGPVILGPLDLSSGVSLALQNKGDFEIRAFAGVGSEERPVFVQISWLGGGAWITCTVVNRRTDEGRETIPEGSIGLALGSIQSVNIANVARGSYSFLLFVNANFTKEGSVLRAGLLVRGSARLLSIATVYVELLLVATHSSRGGTSGEGKLKAKVKISQFYTLRVSKSVHQKI